MGPTVTGSVRDPLAVLILNNRLYFPLRPMQHLKLIEIIDLTSDSINDVSAERSSFFYFSNYIIDYGSSTGNSIGMAIQPATL